jgi:hypothetical protein
VVRNVNMQRTSGQQQAVRGRFTVEAGTETNVLSVYAGGECERGVSVRSDTSESRSAIGNESFELNARIIIEN